MPVPMTTAVMNPLCGRAPSGRRPGFLAPRGHRGALAGRTGVKCLVALLPLVAAFCLGGCASSAAARKASAPNPGEGIPSKAGITACAEGRARWEELLSRQQFGVERQADLGKVVEALDRAIASDPAFPLFLSKKGEMLLENPEPSRVAAARQWFEKSVGPGLDPRATTGSERWAAGWIGLARCWALESDLGKAEEMLRAADDAVTWLDSAPPTRMGGLLGLLLNPPEPNSDPLNPELPESTRKSILVAAMTDDAGWDVSSAALGTPDPALAAVDPKRRVRAEIEFQRSLITKNALDTQAFETVFRWYPDHYRARLEKASRLVRLGQYDEAQGVIQPYADLSNPKLSADPDLLLLMGTIHARQYLLSGAPGQAQQAERFLSLLDQRHPWDARGYILHARVLAKTAGIARDSRALAEAKRQADAGEQRLAAFDHSNLALEVPKWRAELATAREEISKAGGGT